jgi:hypothetical protein
MPAHILMVAGKESRTIHMFLNDGVYSVAE